MNNWQKHSKEEQKQLLQLTAENIEIPMDAVEKDWWVTVTLKALFQTSCADYLLFKGGTSLSKGWNLIQRFSEDIDIAIDQSRFEIDLTPKKGINKLRKASRKYIHEELSVELKEQLDLMEIKNYTIENITTYKDDLGNDKLIDSDKDPTEIHVIYDTILQSSHDYIKPRIKIEISCLSMSEPSEQKDIKSLIYDSFPDEDDETKSIIKTVLPTRTFLEKAFLLSEEFQKENPRSLRMSRHLYDLEKLMDTDFATDALNDGQLYESIVEHRSKFYNLKYVDYNKHHPKIIDFNPPEHLKNDWEKDYKDMQDNFIYGDSISFTELLTRIDVLKSKFQTIPNVNQLNFQ
ncbi:Nucleotidyl transferase AbiEii toxin, Type IV TA system [Bacteroides luti]|uniref:Nucleotidyl transferase AbiEii toxin, Type IV TA system n=1 Tax=Bacteroides luti TaxID=1297750 RepID=A0A1M4T5R0_9BACE|nr:nucleotidyl transferase AbiEii/AbiGii toxin family protein [Bacteroides luti]SHE39771.1 Nucleotidyl transferase AbiEii toxin, Type IV TA system [Bacteroides luti]